MTMPTPDRDLDAEELAAIKARAEAATAGPWYGELGVFSDVYGWEWMPNHEWNGAQDDVDAAFIAHARTDVPALLDEIDRLRAALAATRSAVESDA